MQIDLRIDILQPLNEGQKTMDEYSQKPDTVYYFGTCLIDMFYPQAGMAGINMTISTKTSVPILRRFIPIPP